MLIDECVNDPVGESEACYAKIFANDCRPAKSRLAIFFGGGDAGCADFNYSQGVYSIPAMYTAKGNDFIFICLDIFESNDAMGRYPFNKEASRVSKAVDRLTAYAKSALGWNGQELLFTGISHGASSPMVAMARNSFDGAGSAWHGTVKSGGCFLDGTYDVPSLFDFLRSDPTYDDLLGYPSNLTSCAGLYSRFCNRYTNSYDCDIDSNYTNSGLSAEIVNNVSQDSITTANPANFGIRDFTLVECGSGLTTTPICDLVSGDILPAGPIQSMCSRIDSGSDHTCEFASLPNLSHSICAFMPEAIQHCVNWFKNSNIRH